MFTIQSRFYTTFKTGDNVAYNAQVLRVLYRCQRRATATNKQFFAKPIIIQIMSIAESVMFDLRSRFKHCHREVRTQFEPHVIEHFNHLDKEPTFNQLLAALTYPRREAGS